MALNIDLAPTLLTLAGEPVPPAMQGMDLGPILRDVRAPGRSEWYYEHDVHTASQGRPLPRCEGVRTERWKYIRYLATSPVEEELFDLAADAGEQTNLATNPQHGPLLSEMRQRFAALRTAAK
jgi:arylsulfatase A-like enzyme